MNSVDNEILTNDAALVVEGYEENYHHDQLLGFGISMKMAIFSLENQ